MRIQSSVTSISWIPSEAVQGMTKVPFEMGVAHYDDPPPDHIDSLDQLREADRFRFANELRAWIDVEDGRITGHGQSGGGHIGSTTLRVGSRGMTFAAVPFPDRRQAPTIGDGWVRFTQTAGGRTGVPAPRKVNRPPFIQIAAPVAWTTLTLTIFADGTSSREVTGASTFPRHWVYDDSANLCLKSGLVNFERWSQHAFGRHTPWGDEDSPALVTEVETALERDLSSRLMRGGAKPRIETRQAECRRLSSRAPRGGRCTSSSTASWRSRWPARRSPRSAPARWSESERSSKVAGERQPFGRSPRARSQR